MGKLSINQYTVGSILRSFLKNNLLLSILLIYFVLISSICRILIPLSLGWFYDLVLHQHGPKNTFLSTHFFSFTQTNSFFLFFGILCALAVIHTYLNFYFTQVLEERFSLMLRNLLITQQLKTTSFAHLEKSFGKYLLRYSGDLASVQKLISKGLIQPISDLFTVVLLFYFLIKLSFSTGLLSISLILGGILIIFPINIFLKYSAQSRRNQRSINLNWITLRLLHFDSVKMTNKTNLEISRFYKKSSRLYQLGLKFASLRALTQVFPLFIFNTLVFIVLFLAWTNQPYFTTSAIKDTLLFILLLFYLKNPLTELLQWHTRWEIGLISFRKIIELLNKPKETFDLTQPLVFKKEIELAKVKLSSKPQRLFFDTPLTFLKNNTSIVIGNSDSGKTLAIQLLIGLIIPESGKIRIDGKELDYHYIAKWRKLCTVVSPDYPLFGKHLWQSIGYYNANEKYKEAVALFTYFEITELKNIDTLLHLKIERLSSHLSHQKMLLVLFIRSLLTNKPIIFIDQVIGQLSGTNYDLFVDYLNKLQGKKTIIIFSNQPIQNLNYDKEYQI